VAFGLDFQGAHAVANDPFIDEDEKGGTRWTWVPGCASGTSGELVFGRLSHSHE
jgi:hypothetical protein